MSGVLQQEHRLVYRPAVSSFVFSIWNQFCLVWDHFCHFAYIIRPGDHFCPGITFVAVQGLLIDQFYTRQAVPPESVLSLFIYNQSIIMVVYFLIVKFDFCK